MSATRLLEIDTAAEKLLVDAAKDERPIQGLTHNHYRYPARFSPTFARQVIATFTEPGDLVLDPHVGGGTTIVEAAAAGRDAVGVDLNALAEFVSSVKTTIYDDDEFTALAAWAEAVCETAAVETGGAANPASGTEAEPLPYPKHLDHPDRRPIAAAIARSLTTTSSLPPRLRDFARCVILRTAQIALDGRRLPMAVARFADLLKIHAMQMVDAARTFAAAVSAQKRRPDIGVLLRSASGLEEDPRAQRLGPPRLVLTSPPYPGVHILYNRWQVGGGRETGAPFWIAEREDRSMPSHYTMGDRRTQGREGYFSRMLDVMRSVAALCDEATVVVQMLAFADAPNQLPRYVATMEAAGLAELHLPGIAGTGDGRLWRNVPNRRWYSSKRGATPGSQEVVLFHSLRPATISPPCRIRSDAFASSPSREPAMA